MMRRHRRRIADETRLRLPARRHGRGHRQLRSGGVPTGSPEDDKLSRFFRTWLDEHFRRHPFDATRNGDHRYDDRLDDLSPQSREADRAATAKTLTGLPKEVDYTKLSRAGQIDYEILKHHLTYRLWKEENEKPQMAATSPFWSIGSRTGKPMFSIVTLEASMPLASTKMGHCA